MTGPSSAEVDRLAAALSFQLADYIRKSTTVDPTALRLLTAANDWINAMRKV